MNVWTLIAMFALGMVASFIMQKLWLPDKRIYLDNASDIEISDTDNEEIKIGKIKAKHSGTIDVTAAVGDNKSEKTNKRQVRLNKRKDRILTKINKLFK